MHDDIARSKDKSNRLLEFRTIVFGLTLKLLCIPLLGTLPSCIFLEDENNDYPEPWNTEVVTGALHVGTQTIATWPPPAGECIEGQFMLEDLPLDDNTDLAASRVNLFFNHAGAKDGLLEINDHVVFSRVTWLDTVADAFSDIIASVIVEVAACTVQTLAPGDPDCVATVHGVEATTIMREIPTENLSIGKNSYRVCATAGDFLVADGIRLKEAPPAMNDTNGETDEDAGLHTELDNAISIVH